ncbi:MAG: hypothetical protein VB085_11540 [Peptococcaceae bacterium]|nr:hypothetical protein [Peptococcaceae bacterium]
MNNKTANAGLLCRLADQSGCSYLSDLRTEIYRAEVRRQIRDIPANEYPLEEWREAAAYLVGEKNGCGRADKVKQAIIDTL